MQLLGAFRLGYHFFGGITRRDALAYLPAQVSGGATAANAMFAKPAISIFAHHRSSPAHLLAEVIATLGLILVIFALARTRRSASAPAAVGAYIGAAYFFTSSASFANPAITCGCAHRWQHSAGLHDSGCVGG